VAEPDGGIVLGEINDGLLYI